MKIVALLTLALPSLLPPPPQEAREAAAVRPALEHYNLGKQAVAIDGYDPVAYFPEGGGKPRKGSPDLTLSHRGVTYRFASAADRALFEATPERYEPAYGGWCAYAMADGDKVEVDPESFLLENGQLLLFYDGFFADTRKSWRKQGGTELGPKADVEWALISGEPMRRSVRQFNLDDGVGLGGYDPVSYRQGTPLEGLPRFTAVHEGVTYRFASERNREAFLAAPAKHEPAYGGWCAFALAQEKQVDVDPLAFAYEGGTVYMFADASRRAAWTADAAALGPKADAAWTRLSR